MNNSMKRKLKKHKAEQEQMRKRFDKGWQYKTVENHFYAGHFVEPPRPYAERPNRNTIEKAFAAIAKREQEEACKPASPKDGMEPTVAVQTPNTEPSVKVDAGTV